MGRIPYLCQPASEVQLKLSSCLAHDVGSFSSGSTAKKVSSRRLLHVMYKYRVIVLCSLYTKIFDNTCHIRGSHQWY